MDTQTVSSIKHPLPVNISPALFIISLAPDIYSPADFLLSPSSPSYISQKPDPPHTCVASLSSTTSPAGLVTAFETGCEEAMIARQTFSSSLSVSHSARFLLSSCGKGGSSSKGLLLSKSIKSTGHPGVGLALGTSKLLSGLRGLFLQLDQKGLCLGLILGCVLWRFFSE